MKTRTVDNRNRPARPEPGEDPALEKAPVREKVPVREQARQAQPKKSPRR